MKLSEITNRKEYNFSCIYKFTNLVNGKIYIGQTIDLGMRMTRYRGNNFTNPHFQFAVEKYGIENFEIEIIERDVPIEKLDEREQYWMDFYDSYNPDKGYNILKIAGSSRGHEAWNKGISPTEEHRKHISDGLLKYYSTHTVWNKGVPATEEAKEKNRLSNSGEKNGMWGRTHSEETRKKISKALTGRKMTKEQRRKMSKPVKCVETGEIFESQGEAAKKVGCTQANISAAILTCRAAKKYHWEFVDKEEYFSL